MTLYLQQKEIQSQIQQCQAHISHISAIQAEDANALIPMLDVAGFQQQIATLNQNIQFYQAHFEDLEKRKALQTPAQVIEECKAMYADYHALASNATTPEERNHWLNLLHGVQDVVLRNQAILLRESLPSMQYSSLEEAITGRLGLIRYNEDRINALSTQPIAPPRVYEVISPAPTILPATPQIPQTQSPSFPAESQQQVGTDKEGLRVAEFKIRYPTERVQVQPKTGPALFFRNLAKRIENFVMNIFILISPKPSGNSPKVYERRGSYSGPTDSMREISGRGDRDAIVALLTQMEAEAGDEAIAAQKIAKEAKIKAANQGAPTHRTEDTNGVPVLPSNDPAIQARPKAGEEGERNVAFSEPVKETRFDIKTNRLAANPERVALNVRERNADSRRAYDGKGGDWRAKPKAHKTAFRDVQAPAERKWVYGKSEEQDYEVLNIPNHEPIRIWKQATIADMPEEDRGNAPGHEYGERDWGKALGHEYMVIDPKNPNSPIPEGIQNLDQAAAAGYRISRIIESGGHVHAVTARDGHSPIPDSVSTVQGAEKQGYQVSQLV